MTSSDFIALAALLISCGSAVFSALSWKTDRAQVKASMYPERFAVFKDVKAFMYPWFRDGRPDLKELPLLINAWERSQFLFEPAVTAFLRKLWLDAVSANFHARVVARELKEDHDKSVERLHEINGQYLIGDAEHPDIFMEAFKSMKAEPRCDDRRDAEQAAAHELPSFRSTVMEL